MSQRQTDAPSQGCEVTGKTPVLQLSQGAQLLGVCL